MAGMLPHVLSFAALFSYGLHHLLAACRSHIRSAPHRDYAAQPYHPFLSAGHHRLRHLPIYLLLAALALAGICQATAAAAAPPSSIARLAALQSLVVLLLFFLLAASLRLRPLPNDLSFMLAALAFALRSAAFDTSDDLPALCERISSTIAASSSALCLFLVFFPKIFAAEVALAASVALQGLWSLQTGLSLFAEAFIPDGCHRQLEGEGWTKCDLAESRRRAAALLDLAVSIHATVIAVLAAAVVYLAKARRAASYDALPSASSSVVELDHVQVKTAGKSTMQA